ncbi:unnamed protein product [Brachionus calyciflorus]|uniref:Reverse transcriptase RNase H-like domain-containing protein n=1 Tax=Brachionus calyciflorus TaxID=104777 RepID=A0A814R0Q2_9BILA|nr:unnamed protein product [Brachionus calyciflorus]
MVDILLTKVVDEVDIEDESDWETQELKFEPSIPLDGLQLKQFKSQMKKNRDMFALSIEDLGECAVREHIINLIDESPIFLQPYRKSASERNEIQKEIKKMLKPRINAEKCTWCAQSLKVLGNIVSKNDISMDPAKIEAIKNRVAPKNVKQLQQFIGLCNYYRRFIKDFAKKATSLFKLLQKDVKWIWSEECEASFLCLKEKLVSRPTLRLPDLNRPFILYTAASGYALEAILTQKDYDEVNYGITENESLAVVWAIKFYRVYLYGTHFKVITDHSAFAWLMKIVDPTVRLARWSIYLQAYDFEIIHRKGKVHSNVDALSRPVLSTEVIRTDSEESEDSQGKTLDP